MIRRKYPRSIGDLRSEIDRNGSQEVSPVSYPLSSHRTSKKLRDFAEKLNLEALQEGREVALYVTIYHLAVAIVLYIQKLASCC